MEKPIIKDQKTKEYIDYLEKQINNYSSETPIAKLYVATIKQINGITDLFNSMTISNRDMSDKDDRMFDRYFKVQSCVLSMARDLKELENLVNPKIVADVKEAGSKYEEILNKLSV